MGRHTTPLGASKLQHEKTKEAIPSIDIVSHMWLGFPIHEAIAIQWGKEIIHEHQTTEEFTRLGTPTKEIIEFKTLRRAFPHVPQVYYPHEHSLEGNRVFSTRSFDTKNFCVGVLSFCSIFELLNTILTCT